MFIRRIDVEGEFEMLWKDVEEKKLLSYDIIESIPRLITEKTKKRLIKKSPEEVVALIKSAIGKINAGSVETIDSLLRKGKRHLKKTKM